MAHLTLFEATLDIMTIKILSNSTINKIAAGEVIERPASVVKELVENAIDAGASKIIITLETAGKNLIIISDDGIGMTKEELELSVMRHATSKLDEEDLLNINSFGFRGEALPSIAAISKFKITSKKKQADKSYSFIINGGEKEPTVLSTSNEGTTIEVRDLFFATPARLKFLRTDKTELAASISVVKKIALSHPHISFTLIHDSKEILKVHKQKGTLHESLKKRVSEIMGQEFIDNSIPVELTRDNIEIYGYTGLPTYNRASGEDQFLFVNNRPVKDKILSVALKVAYQDFLARDRYSLSALFLRVKPETVDVNVHPAKTEVRFHDPGLIKNLLISAVKDALFSAAHRVSNSTANKALEYMVNTSPGLRETSYSNHFHQNQSPSRFTRPGQVKKDHRPQSPLLRADYSAATQPALPQSRESLFYSYPQAKTTESQSMQPGDNSAGSKYPLGAAKAQLHKTYIISQTEDGIIITDQHAAHERLGYEKIKQQIAKQGLIKQRLLIPEIVDLPDEVRAEAVNEYKNELFKLGLSIEKFGNKSIIVSEIPSLIGDADINRLIHDLSDHLLEKGENIALDELIEKVTETYACHYAIRAGRELSAAEMNEILRQMEITPFSGQCNHGRPTYVELKLKDIEKLFGRK